MLEEECSLVEEVVAECREVERQKCRLKDQECSSLEREQCWLGPVGREVSLNKWLLSTVKKIVSSLIGPDTLFIRMGSVLANMAGHYIT